jgi:hypothetical protein
LPYVTCDEPLWPLLNEATRGDEMGLATRSHKGGVPFVPTTQGSTMAQMDTDVHKNAYG